MPETKVRLFFYNSIASETSSSGVELTYNDGHFKRILNETPTNLVKWWIQIESLHAALCMQLDVMWTPFISKAFVAFAQPTRLCDIFDCQHILYVLPISRRLHIQHQHHLTDTGKKGIS